VEAAAATLAAFSMMLCVSYLPDVIRGPWGYGRVVPSRIVVFLLNFAPTNWFCYAAAPLVFGIIFLRKADSSALAPRVIAIVVLCFLGPAAFVASDLISLHGMYAVEPVPASKFTVAINLILIVTLVFSLVNAWRLQPQIYEREHESPGPANGDSHRSSK